MSTVSDPFENLEGEEPSGRDPISALAVYRFVWDYWRRVPWRLTGMLVGTTLGVLLEVQIPRLSAALVVATERHISGQAPVAAAWLAVWQLVAIFAAVFIVKQIYLRNWMYLATEVMQNLVSDGFRQVQRFSHEWHINNFAGSTQRKITRGMWAYDSLADTTVIDLGPALGLLLGFTITMGMRDPVLGAYFGCSVGLFVGISVLMSLKYVAPANIESNDADTELGGFLADAITCSSVVRA